MLKNVYEGLNARPKVYLYKEYFCEMYPTCVSSKLCEFIWEKMVSDGQTVHFLPHSVIHNRKAVHLTVLKLWWKVIF